MAGAGGFEPPYGGIKIRCLTAWRRPNMCFDVRRFGPDQRADHNGAGPRPQPHPFSRKQGGMRDGMRDGMRPLKRALSGP